MFKKKKKEKKKKRENYIHQKLVCVTLDQDRFFSNFFIKYIFRFFFLPLI